MRTISLFFTQESREVMIDSDATTLGQLKSAIPTESLGGKKLTVRETRSTLESDDSILPTGEFTLYVYPAKSKAGYDTGDDDSYKLDEIYKELVAQRKLITKIAQSQGLISQDDLNANSRAEQLRLDAEKLEKEMNG